MIMKSLSYTHTFESQCENVSLALGKQVLCQKRALNNSIFGLMEFHSITCPSGRMLEMKIEVYFSRLKWHYGILFIFTHKSLRNNMGHWDDDLVTSLHIFLYFKSKGIQWLERPEFSWERFASGKRDWRECWGIWENMILFEQPGVRE